MFSTKMQAASTYYNYWKNSLYGVPFFGVIIIIIIILGDLDKTNVEKI